MVESIEDKSSEFKISGFEILEREVKQSGNSGRIYLPKNWIGSRVKIIRITKLKE
ncbi:MAG: DUF2080 family transposase-associated protein [Candidatus Hodarchaeota archaeon]